MTDGGLSAASFRGKVLAAYRQATGESLARLRQMLSDLQESVSAETKSTAGDKYETARAMLHIEQDNVSRQLRALQEQNAVLDRVGAGDAPVDTIALGSLVETSGGWYLLGPALGKMLVDGTPVFALSPRSPLGQQLSGKTAGCEVTVTGRSVQVLAIS